MKNLTSLKEEIESNFSEFLSANFGLFEIVLHEPRIPQNTGNIGRLCVGSNAKLHLIHPLGFNISQKELKRAGMDYWERLDLKEHKSAEEFFKENPLVNEIKSAQNAAIESNMKSSAKIPQNATKAPKPHFFLTTKAQKSHFCANFQNGAFLHFGREDAGLKAELLAQNAQNCLRIPMLKEERSINLANSVAIVLYEALRQAFYK